jgi:hypothetical protein
MTVSPFTEREVVSFCCLRMQHECWPQWLFRQCWAAAQRRNIFTDRMKIIAANLHADGDGLRKFQEPLSFLTFALYIGEYTSTCTTLRGTKSPITGATQTHRIVRIVKCGNRLYRLQFMLFHYTTSSIRFHSHYTCYQILLRFFRLPASSETDIGI